MPSEEPLPEDDGPRTETYEEVDDEEEARGHYQKLTEAALDYNFDREDDQLEFEKLYWQAFGFKSEINGCFLHYWAKSHSPSSPSLSFGKWLLLKRPDMINQVDKDRRTPIHTALENKSSEGQKFLKLLVEECPRSTLIKVLAKKALGEHNCLHYAILRSHPWTLKLIEKCQSPSERHLFTAGDSEGKTPLHLAMVPPKDKKQSKLFSFKQPVEGRKNGFSETQAFRTGNGDIGNKELRSPLPLDKSELKDKERNSRNRDDSKDRYSTTKETPRTNYGLQRRPTTDFGNTGGGRSIPPSTTTFPSREVVQNLMKYGREALWEVDTKDKKTPYQYRLQLLRKKNNSAVEEEAVRRMVSEDAVAQDMKEFCLRNLPRGDAMRSLYEKGKEKHIEFDLSGVPNPSISKSDLVRLNSHLNFEDTLQYVAIPRLRVEDPVITPSQPLIPSTAEHQGKPNGTPNNVSQPSTISKTEPHGGSKEVATDPKVPSCAGLKDAGIIFNWLSESKVSRIFKVIVVDDGPFPHSNQVIEDSLRGFKIETWDWKKVDIPSDTILAAASGARTVNLYSSGNSAVLKGWSCTDGLVKLKSLEKLILNVRPGFETHKRRSEDVDKFKTDFKKNWSDSSRKAFPKIDVVWDDEKTSLTSWIQTDPQDKAPDEKQRWLKHMDAFASFIANVDLEREEKERKLQYEKEKEDPRMPQEKRTKQLEDIKVALIDDGVDGFDPIISKSIANGVSFCQGSSNLVRSYYVSKGGHGTMMAQLILRMCPTAKLYVARLQEYTSVTARRRFISPESATEAVNWAITNGVRILSISWTIEGSKEDPSIKNLKAAINKARTDHNIIIMCSFSDQGLSAPAENTFPTAWREDCNIIGAATKGGDASPLVNKNEIDFLFPGENIAIEAEPPKLLSSRRAESGSSISTALATGTASMLLFITQLVDAALYEKLKNPRIMKIALTRLCSGNTGPGNSGQYFDARKFSLDFKKTEWRWDGDEYRAGKGWEEVKKLVEDFVKPED